MSGIQSLIQDAVKVYDMEYFSGSQVAIYIGDVWVDEIVHFQLELTQVKNPIYGYASELWDALARGPKLVRGAFTVNFKEAGYLFAVLKHYQERIKGRDVLSPYSSGNKIMRANIERIMSLEANDADLFRAYADMASYASEKQKRNKGLDKAEDLFEDFEDAIWKKRGMEEFYNKYGITSRSSLTSCLNGFDIFIQFGDFTNDLSNHTIIKLETVELVGQAMTIESSGAPVLEVYNFIARNWV